MLRRLWDGRQGVARMRHRRPVHGRGSGQPTGAVFRGWDGGWVVMLDGSGRSGMHLVVGKGDIDAIAVVRRRHGRCG